jgi:7,8-dihydroneopterin aldolase/epimerase/oxygenase
VPHTEFLGSNVKTRMDKIIVKDARFLARVGVSEEERARPQEIFLDIYAYADLRPANRTDDFERAICYRQLHQAAAAVVDARPYHLIETIAERIAEDLLQRFPVGQVVIQVRKPGALRDQDVRFAAVEITRTQNG